MYGSVWFQLVRLVTGGEREGGGGGVMKSERIIGQLASD